MYASICKEAMNFDFASRTNSKLSAFKEKRALNQILGLD